MAGMLSNILSSQEVGPTVPGLFFTWVVSISSTALRFDSSPMSELTKPL